MTARWQHVLVLLCLVSTFFSSAHAQETMPTQPLNILAHPQQWLNTSRPLAAEELEGRIILLDFWTFCCINCMHVIPDLKYLEETFGDKLTVIGVHSAKFANEKDTENIRSAILRYGIEHPVVNDFDFFVWQNFGVRSWPSFVLINPQGRIDQVYSGEGNREKLQADIERLIADNPKLVMAKLPIALEKDKAPEGALSFPGKLEYAADAGGSPAIFVADSGHNRILALTLEGNLRVSVGSGKAGFKDGSFATAEFRSPQGMQFAPGKAGSIGVLYVADTENHAIRAIDFDAKTVTTVAGTGVQGYEREAKNAPALTTKLASPWDVKFFPDTEHLVIAMAGTHQLWSYDIAAKTVSVIAGNGRESIDDGRYPANSLSQPSGMAAIGTKLYFVDSETSSLRVLENGVITTLIGSGLFDFGFKDGAKGTALLQHPLGVFADGQAVYIADSYNHAIRRYDPATGALSTIAGDGKRGVFNEPNAVVRVGEKLLVADTNNHALRIITLASNAVGTLAVTLPEAENAPPFSGVLPNAQQLPAVTLAPGPVTLSLTLAPGWKINHEAPSYVAVYGADNEHKVMAQAGRAALQDKRSALTALAPGQYRLQAMLYYCMEEAGSQCLVKSVDMPVTVAEGGVSAITIPVN